MVPSLAAMTYFTSCLVPSQQTNPNYSRVRIRVRVRVRCFQQYAVRITQCSLHIGSPVEVSIVSIVSVQLPSSCSFPFNDYACSPCFRCFRSTLFLSIQRPCLFPCFRCFPSTAIMLVVSLFLYEPSLRWTGKGGDGDTYIYITLNPILTLILYRHSYPSPTLHPPSSILHPNTSL